MSESEGFTKSAVALFSEHDPNGRECAQALSYDNYVVVVQRRLSTSS